mmetsp:Transcript_21088/g.63447  ORF Transcript_21088/g.63447 Transcript_21088/m.63447 type:complete len:205 (+) Transcript_21088:681-1295(+)
MNLAALAARGSDIQRSLDEMTIGLNHNAHNISWSDTLDRFAVLDVQMQQLKAQLRPMTKRHVVYPRAVQLDAAMARVLPIMLATRVVPDMEEVQTAHLAAHRQAAGAAPVDAQYYRLVETTERFNTGIEKLVGSAAVGMKPGGGGSVGVLSPAGPQRRALLAAGKPTTVKAGGAAQLRKGPSAKKRKTPEQSSLLAAVFSGEGL